MSTEYYSILLSRQSWLYPPKKRGGKEFDIWCYAMYERKHCISEIAEVLGISENRVKNAISRVQRGRYSDIAYGEV